MGCFKKTGKDFTTLAKSYDIDAVRSAMFIDLSPFPCFYDASARLILTTGFNFAIETRKKLT